MMSKTVAILYPGEMGAAIAGVLRGNGVRMVTTLADRGPATAQRSRAAGIEVLENLEAVVRAADVVLSVVPPAAAEGLAQSYAALAPMAPRGAIFVDVNSIRPELAEKMASMIEDNGVSFVDGSINGLAKNLTTAGTMYLSGPRAAAAAQMFSGVHRVHVLGERIGQASCMKMLLSGLSKGICALFTELALLAQRQEALRDFIGATASIYPGIWGLIERMLPTYAQHAVRRASEMRELEETATGAGIEPCLIAAIRDLHEQFAAISLEPSAEQGAQSVLSLIEQFAGRLSFTIGPAAAEMIHSAH